MSSVKYPLLLAALTCVALAGCGDSDDNGSGIACAAEPEVMTSSDSVEFVRTPDACFEGLQDWPYEPNYIEIEGLRQAYVDEGPADGPVVLLLHGQPSWSYLYRKMIPVLVEGEFRVIAMDHLGMGRSDKPVDIDSYSYLDHNERLLTFMDELDLQDINLFVQDWGSAIGLRIAGLHPERFARIAVGDGTLTLIPEGIQPFPAVENPDEVEDIPSPFEDIPPQQELFYDGCELIGGPRFETSFADYFGEWANYAMKSSSFQPSVVMEALTWFDLPDEEAAAYDAPFPSRVYMAGPRVFPSLVNEIPGTTQEAWAGLTAFEGPFLTLWAANDPGGLGSCATQQNLVNAVPGAVGQPHDRLAEASHFLQDDQGTEIAGRLVEFYSDRSDRTELSSRGDRYCEILLGYQIDGALRAEVWGTQGVNQCPASQWEAIDPASVQAEYGAAFIVMNGPRAGVMDMNEFEFPDVPRRWYGDEALEMQLAAILDINPAQASAGAYTESRVDRTTVFEFWSGFESYQLSAPNGATYVMQSLSQIVDPDLTLDDLSELGSRLALPPGWRYEVNRRITDLVLAVDGEAYVVTDELDNTYQRVSVGTPSQAAAGTTSQALPILDDGTGTLCTSDTDCEGLDPSHCLNASMGGFCTHQACGPGSCGSTYVCCHSCNESFATLLPFEGSACVPETGTGTLTVQAGCTCD
ncbi:MAG: haloalkane dehalogenase [Pseudomonadota bacterium]